MLVIKYTYEINFFQKESSTIKKYQLYAVIPKNQIALQVSLYY